MEKFEIRQFNTKRSGVIKDVSRYEISNWILDWILVHLFLWEGKSLLHVCWRNMILLVWMIGVKYRINIE